MCDPNASCRHGPSGWGCTCNCGYYGDGKTCTQLTSTLPCGDDQTTCPCRRGWTRPRHNAECRVADASYLHPCQYHGDSYLKFLNLLESPKLGLIHLMTRINRQIKNNLFSILFELISMMQIEPET